jgi:hypothetical protein
MEVKKLLCILVVLIGSILVLSQEYSTTNQSESTITLEESKPSLDNATPNDITKKEQEIYNLINKINENIIKANTSNSLRTKKTILAEVDQLKLNLKNLMKEYAQMIKSYNDKIKQEIKLDIPSVSIPENLTDVQLDAYEKELRNIANKINDKASLANNEPTEEGKKNYIQQIEQLKNEFFNKKAKYLQLVIEYNKRVEEALKLNEPEEGQPQQP